MDNLKMVIEAGTRIVNLREGFLKTLNETVELKWSDLALSHNDFDGLKLAAEVNDELLELDTCDLKIELSDNVRIDLFEILKTDRVTEIVSNLMRNAFEDGAKCVISEETLLTCFDSDGDEIDDGLIGGALYFEAKDITLHEGDFNKGSFKLTRRTYHTFDISEALFFDSDGDEIEDPGLLIVRTLFRECEKVIIEGLKNSITASIDTLKDVAEPDLEILSLSVAA